MDQIKTGKLIQTLRKEQGLTQKELAQAVGVSDKAISKWENGNGFPDVSNMLDLCRNLHISVNELLAGERIATEEYSLKAEENIVELLETNKKTERTKHVYLILGMVLLVCGGTLIIINNYGMEFLWKSRRYIDVTCFLAYVMGIAACTFISVATKGKDLFNEIRKLALPVGAVITIVQLVAALFDNEPQTMAVGIAIAILPMLYALIFYICLNMKRKEKIEK